MRLGSILLLFFATAVGCGRDGSDGAAPAASSYGSLPGLRETPDRELQNELARIVDEQGTPEQLARSEIAADRNVAAGFSRLFLPSRVTATFDETGEIFPEGRFAFNPVRLEKAIEFARAYATQHERAREALDRPECSFAIRYQDGFEADLAFIEVVWTCARLEAFAAAEAMERNDFSAAIEAWGYMLRLAACLAAEKHAICRSEAVSVRQEAMAVAAAIAEHPAARRDDLADMAARLDDALTLWPSDAQVWIGDRALGMHAYEMVRAGRLRDLLTPDEIAEFTREGILDELPADAQRTVNQDELYYLRTMRALIVACSRPFFARADVFESIRRDLQENRNTPEFPTVAARLLLKDIEKGQEWHARDRALCEAWALGLAAAAGEPRPAYEVNPATGLKYQLRRENGVVLVWNVRPGDTADRHTVLVRDLAGEPAKQ